MYTKTKSEYYSTLKVVTLVCNNAAALLVRILDLY